MRSEDADSTGGCVLVRNLLPRRGVRQSLMRWAAWVVAGVLSAGCSSPDVDRTSPAVELGDPSFHATIEAYAGAPILAGNDVRILLNGDAIFPVLLRAIRSARTSITYAQYFFEEGPVADDVVAALAGRCRPACPHTSCWTASEPSQCRRATSTS
jgi:hypothetical protein